MEPKRVGVADIIMAVGGAMLVAAALLPWFGPKGQHEFFASSASVNGLTRFSYFGWLTALIGLAMLELVQVRALAPGRFKLPVPDALIGMILGGVTIVVGIVEMIWQPMAGGVPNEFIDLQWGLFVTLVGGFVVVGGSFLKLADHQPSTGAVAGQPQYAAPYGGQQYAAPQAPPQYAAPQAPQQYAAPQAPPQYAAPQYAPPQAPAPQAAPAPPQAAAQPASPPATAAGACASCGAAYPAADAQFCTNCGVPRAQ
jgi:hypothetical protein